MGLFQQRPEDEQQQWAGLPSEPRAPESAADHLEAAADDLMMVGAQYTSVVLPVAPPAPEAEEKAEDSED